MSQEPNLEERLSENTSPAPTANLSFLGKIKYHAPYFVVDGTSNMVFNGPFMLVTELLSGMEWDEIERSRGIGAATAFLTGYLYNYFGRQKMAETVGVNVESARAKKRVVDATVGMATTALFYAPQLYLADVSTEEMAVALGIGSFVGGILGLFYGPVADKWRIYCGLQPVLNK